MKSESEIIASNLEDRQRLWVELKKVKVGDRDYANARALIDVIEATDDWDKPATDTYTVIQDVSFHGNQAKKGATIDAFPWEYKALRRFLRTAKEIADAAKKKESAAKTAIATLIAAFALMLFGSRAEAQTQPYLIGGSGQYNVVNVASLNGGTNSVVGTNTYSVAVTNTVTITTNANWQYQGLLWTNIPTYTTNTTVNVPGMVNVVNVDMFSIFWQFQLTASGTGTAFSSWDYSDDAVNWQTNALTLSLVANGVNTVSTNCALTLFPHGYVRLNQQWYASATVFMTNNTVELAKKPYRTGP